MKMPDQIENASKFGARLGIEYGFMSTTTDKAIAVHYGQDTWSGHGLSYVLQFEMDSLNRGALIQWLSQYPGEAEVCPISQRTCVANKRVTVQLYIVAIVRKTPSWPRSWANFSPL
jgi:hypothetical protein